MFKDLPPEIQEAINILWDYADDAYASGRTRQECDEEGFECKGSTCHLFKFVISRKEVDDQKT